MQVTEELIQPAKDLDAATKAGKEMGLTDDEKAFYDALAANDSAGQEHAEERQRRSISQPGGCRVGEATLGTVGPNPSTPTGLQQPAATARIQPRWGCGSIFAQSQGRRSGCAPTLGLSAATPLAFRHCISVCTPRQRRQHGSGGDSAHQFTQNRFLPKRFARSRPRSQLHHARVARRGHLSPAPAEIPLRTSL